MTIIFIIVSLSYLAVIVFLAVTWYKDLKHKEDTDKRILILEKRINEKESKEEVKKIKDFINNFAIDMNDYRIRIEKIERKRNIQKNS